MSGHMNDFKVGMAKADITPKLGCLLYGYAEERRAQRVMDRLEVGVVAIEQNSEILLLVSAEICGINHEKCQEMRENIGKALGVRWENVLFATIHTHSGPVTRTAVGWGVADMEYLDNVLLAATIKAAREAMEGMKSAVMGIGITESLVGINRREMNSDGEVVLGQNPDAPYNPTMTVVNFKAVTGENIGSIVHFAAHPTSADRNLSITRDWPGLMIDRLTEITGSPCMYINGAEGDVGPRLSNGKTTGGESYVIETGRIAAADVEKAFHNIDTYEVPDLKVFYGNVMIPYVTPPTIEEVEQRIIAMGDPAKLYGPEGTDVPKYAQLLKAKSVYVSGEEFPTELVIPQTVVALGELALVPMCFEAFCNIALAIRDGSPYKNTLLLGLTGGSYGYLPTEDQIPAGGYEIASFRLSGGSPVSFVDNADQYVIRQNVELLKEMKLVETA